MMSRREFLQYSVYTLGLVALRPFLAASPVTASDQSDCQSGLQTAVPPSLMLHAAEGAADFFPYLLDALQEDGFQATTYIGWREAILADNPIAKPIIISIDDISFSTCCAQFERYVRMKNWLMAAGMTAVYAVITEPICDGGVKSEQVESRWDIAQMWAAAGFELATHTSHHSNFNAADSLPRADFTAADYEVEIARSAHLIEEKLGERGLPYAVQTLITPYGSGYAYKQSSPYLHPPIAAVCLQTNIRMVVGIAGGRGPIPVAQLRDGCEPAYLGRVPPGFSSGEDDARQPDIARTRFFISSWQWMNNRLFPPPSPRVGRLSLTEPAIPI